jgi:hypothetical protein
MNDQFNSNDGMNGIHLSKPTPFVIFLVIVFIGLLALYFVGTYILGKSKSTPLTEPEWTEEMARKKQAVIDRFRDDNENTVITLSRDEVRAKEALLKSIREE